MNGPRRITTYSMWRMFLNCRKQMQWRYLRELVPLERTHSLYFGSLIHDCLEHWHRHRDLAVVLEQIDRVCPERVRNERQRSDWHLARAMMRGYAGRYPDEDFEVVALEQPFEGPIVNPRTGRTSRTFKMAGKIDGIVRREDGYYLLEHKTAATVDAGYLEKLWTDFQIILYALYAESVLGIRVRGILYNILVKAKLQQKRGETQAEFEERRAVLIAKSKTGKSTAKRQKPETDDTFQARLLKKYQDPAMFHREMLFLSRDQYTAVRQEIWDLAKALLEAQRTGVFLPNRAQCFQYGRPCAYLPLCRSNGNPNLIENLYRKEPPHQELKTQAASETLPF